jgi:ATP-dependent phosphofructokinase / diphosphate-dependent phosphofructokinase
MSSNAEGRRRRVGLVFSGGPAPAANAVIGAAASAFRRAGWDVLGFANGYSHFDDYDPDGPPLAEGTAYRLLEDRDLWGLRTSRGILIGTARTNPGRDVHSRAHLDDPARTEPLRRVYRGLVDLGVEALISIGGDDTLKTANFLHEYQKRLPASEPRVRVLHVPKTIDNDYRGIDFTFGFFTAVGVMGEALLNLRADARATGGYFIVETMGRKAGWLSYGVAVAGEAHMVVGVEDVHGDLATHEAEANAAAGDRSSLRLDLEALVARIVELIVLREARGKSYGTVVLAEGLAELLPAKYTMGLGRDEHGHISLGKMDLGKLVAELVSRYYAERTGRKKKVTGVQLGYESRSSAPHAFDVLLGSQLGLGAFRGIALNDLDGVMVSVKGQLDIRYVPFEQLIEPETLLTEVRYIELGSDFHRLAHELGTRLEPRPPAGGDDEAGGGS